MNKLLCNLHSGRNKEKRRFTGWKAATLVTCLCFVLLLTIIFLPNGLKPDDQPHTLVPTTNPTEVTIDPTEATFILVPVEFTDFIKFNGINIYSTCCNFNFSNIIFRLSFPLYPVD